MLSWIKSDKLSSWLEQGHTHMRLVCKSCGHAPTVAIEAVKSRETPPSVLCSKCGKSDFDTVPINFSVTKAATHTVTNTAKTLGGLIAGAAQKGSETASGAVSGAKSTASSVAGAGSWAIETAWSSVGALPSQTTERVMAIYATEVEARALEAAKAELALHSDERWEQLSKERRETILNKHRKQTQEKFRGLLMSTGLAAATTALGFPMFI